MGGRTELESPGKHAAEALMHCTISVLAQSRQTTISIHILAFADGHVYLTSLLGDTDAARRWPRTWGLSTFLTWFQPRPGSRKLRELPGLFNRGVSSRSQSCCHCIAVVGVTTLEPQIMGPGPNIINVRCQIIAANRPRRPRGLLVAQSDMASG